jgi:hypothetical protein
LPERIGNTPVVRLDRVIPGLQGITLLGNAEWANPGNSVKTGSPRPWCATPSRACCGPRQAKPEKDSMQLFNPQNEAWATRPPQQRKNH